MEGLIKFMRAVNIVLFFICVSFFFISMFDYNFQRWITPLLLFLSIYFLMNILTTLK